MGRSKTFRCLVIALLAAAILLTAGASMASSQNPPAAIVSRTGQRDHGRWRLRLDLPAPTRCGAWVSQPTTLASGGGYRLMAPAQPAADGSGCCCKCYLPYIRKQ